MDTIAAALQHQLEQYTDIPGFANIVKSAVGFGPEEDIGDIVLAWRVEISEAACVVWLVTDGGFVFIEIAAVGTILTITVPAWRIRQVVERVADGQVSVAIEVEADKQRAQGQFTGPDGTFELSGVPFQYQASEALVEDGESPLQIFARATRALCLSA